MSLHEELTHKDALLVEQAAIAWPCIGLPLPNLRHLRISSFTYRTGLVSPIVSRIRHHTNQIIKPQSFPSCTEAGVVSERTFQRLQSEIVWITLFVFHVQL
eukprot:6188892-Pleurochrysis_carterae.AAC.4